MHNSVLGVRRIPALGTEFVVSQNWLVAGSMLSENFNSPNVFGSGLFLVVMKTLHGEAPISLIQPTALPLVHPQRIWLKTVAASPECRSRLDRTSSLPSSPQRRPQHPPPSAARCTVNELDCPYCPHCPHCPASPSYGLALVSQGNRLASGPEITNRCETDSRFTGGKSRW